ncbi:hypothetical protein T05_3760 [Trichinella murrelli]|uniref:Uncharacterized protein n=1 Tax=Trichinella murrelli TaxID=144512 RepID=A0A0V0SWW7_9BILA|nr:hypothetical protein T05_1934 [Trichinella murrelli]KRX32799.1 hypothetical protein T05_3760 [Trichinella murrelli]
MSLQFSASKILPATCCKMQILHNKIQGHVQLLAGFDESLHSALREVQQTNPRCSSCIVLEISQIK